MHSRIERRTLVQGLIFGAPLSLATFQVLGQATPGAAGSGVLLAFFSRAYENYYHGDRIDLEIGNTKIVAGLISDRIGCDVYEILATDPYPEDYEETRERNVQEQDADARPEIANPLASIDAYDTIIIGGPIWSTRPPMIMSTFTESFDFTGKTVLPLVTYAVSGMGSAERVYQEACRGATLGEGLAVQGEDVTDAPDDVAAAVDTWLQRVGLTGA
jgi:flavodoxin